MAKLDQSHCYVPGQNTKPNKRTKPLFLKKTLRTTQAGHALLTALFIMTLVAIVATAMTLRTQQDINRVRLIINYDKLNLANDFATFWARDRLSMKQIPEQALDDQGKIIELPAPYQTIVPDITLNSAIYDLQAFFNLNNLQTQSGQAMFDALLKELFKNWGPSERKKRIASIRYWINPYQPDKGIDEALQYYLNQTPAYLPGYQLLKTISEMRMIQGITAKHYFKMAPYLTALPEPTRINLYTAPKKILKLLNTHLTEEQLERLYQLRYARKKVSQNYLGKLLKQMNINNDAMTLESQYFLCITTSKINGATQTQYTTLKRYKDKRKQIKVSVIQVRINSI